ncbi:hypothetical protein SALBM311S_10559 [Streptomyces alboniger]
MGWVGDTALRSPQTVLASFIDGIGFRDHAEPHALRRPQIGALHSVIGYWASGATAPATVVMPTGTGKTETMLALLVAARPSGCSCWCRPQHCVIKLRRSLSRSASCTHTRLSLRA